MPQAVADFELLFAALPGATFATTPAGRVVAASDRLLAALGTTRSVVVGRSLEALAGEGAIWAEVSRGLLDRVAKTRATASGNMGNRRLHASPAFADGDRTVLAYVLLELEAQSPGEPSSGYLHAFTESLGFGVVIQDAAGVITHANRAATELLGLSLDQLRGLTSADPHWRITKEDGTPEPPDNQPVSRARLSGESVRGVIQGVYSGSENQRWILTDAIPIKDADGKLKEAVVSFVDVTERVQASAQLRRERDFSDSLIASLPDVFYLADTAGGLVRWNRRLEEVSGYSAEEIATMNALALTPEALRPALEAAMRQALEAGNATFEGELLTKNGARLPYALTGTRFCVDGQTYLLGTARDISERKMSEQVLRESEARFRAMADTAPVFIWMVDQDTGASYFSEGWLQFTGRSLEEERGEGWLRSVHPDDRARTLATANEAVAARRPFELEYRLRRRDGVYRWIADRGVPRVLPDGTLVGYIGSCIDITERREVEEALRTSEERYRTLFSSIDEGFCLIELLFDGTTPIDYRFVETNPAFAHMTGLKDAVGKTALELVPELEPWWIETYGKVAVTGETIRFENRSAAMHRWFDVYASRVGGETSRQVALVFTDISKRKEAEEKLRDQHALLSAITDNAASGLFMMDRRGHPTFMNPAAEKITGYTLAEIRDKPLHDTIHHSHPDGRPYPMEDCPIGRASAELKAIRYHEDVFVRKDGSFFPVVVHLAPLEQGSVTTGAVIEFRDVSESKQAEAERRKSEEGYSLLVQSVKDYAIYMLDPDGRVTSWNIGAQRILGYRTEEVIGQHVSLFYTPDAQASDRFQRALEAAVAEGRYEEEGQRVRKDGSRFWAHVTVTALYDQEDGHAKLRGFSKVTRDITRQKEIEFEREALLASEHQARVLAEQAGRRLAFLAEASTTLATSLDYEATLRSLARLVVPEIADWCTIDVLDDEGALVRVALEHADPDKVAFGRALQMRYPPDLAAEQGVAQVLRSGQAELYADIPDTTLQAAATDDAHLALLRTVGMHSAMIVPLKVRERVIGAITLVTAESERRYTETDLELAQELARRAAVAVDNARLFANAQDLNESLEQRVALRTQQLEQINHELEAFAYAVSHDLRTPLSGIDGFSQALLEDYGETLDETANHYLTRIQVNTRRMGQLIDDILKLSRVSRHALKLRRIDLSAMAQEIAAALRERYKSARVDFRCDAGLSAEGDEGLLRIALENLLDNAWKFSSLQEDARIDFRCQRQGGEAVYAVCDNGAGFDMVYAHQLFQPFHRLHSEAGFKGTGIGLVTVKRIVERHGGRIWASAEVDRGATFFFTLNASKTLDSHDLEGKYGESQ